MKNKFLMFALLNLVSNIYTSEKNYNTITLKADISKHVTPPPIQLSAFLLNITLEVKEGTFEQALKILLPNTTINQDSIENSNDNLCIYTSYDINFINDFSNIYYNYKDLKNLLDQNGLKIINKSAITQGLINRIVIDNVRWDSNKGYKLKDLICKTIEIFKKNNLKIEYIYYAGNKFAGIDDNGNVYTKKDWDKGDGLDYRDFFTH